MKGFSWSAHLGLSGSLQDHIQGAPSTPSMCSPSGQRIARHSFFLSLALSVWSVEEFEIANSSRLHQH